MALYGAIIRVVALFGHSKAKLWVNGRKDLFQKLSTDLKSDDRPLVWFHAASLGEYEMAKPIIECYRKDHSNYRILLTLFSPSGYEHLKDKKVSDHISYLALDTPRNAKKFINIVRPTKAIFIKNEIWLNHLGELKKNEIPTYLVSGIFRDDQIYFRSFGKLFKKALSDFKYIFVQDEISNELLLGVGLKKVVVTGDTRMDRTFQNAEETEFPSFLNQLKNDKLTLILGSSWSHEEQLTCEYYNENKDDISLIIAPHDISDKRINSIKDRFGKVSLLSEIIEGSEKVENVVVVDTMGHLMKLYKIADIAFVGGGWQGALHNVLEPAAFGIPVLFGPEIDKFPEAKTLISRKAGIRINDRNALHNALNELVLKADFRLDMGKNAKNFIEEDRGATKKAMELLEAIEKS